VEAGLGQMDWYIDCASLVGFDRDPITFPFQGASLVLKMGYKGTIKRGDTVQVTVPALSCVPFRIDAVGDLTISFHHVQGADPPRAPLISVVGPAGGPQLVYQGVPGRSTNMFLFDLSGSVVIPAAVVAGGATLLVSKAMGQPATIEISAQ